MDAIRIGTRGSKLALWQAEWVAGQLAQRGISTELIIISTSGDTSTAPLSQVGGQGLFTKEIQRELIDGRVDVAVHSLKDLPTQPIDQLTLAAVPIRETTADCLISGSGAKFQQLPSGARIGTGSLRRAAQLRAWRSDIQVVSIRGNVDSRLRKLDEGQYDAIILAAAGLTRLKLTGRISQVLPEQYILPAIGQGALGLECRRDDQATLSRLQLLDDSASHTSVLAEREFLRTLLAGCLAPVAGHAVCHQNQLRLQGKVLSADGTRSLEGQISGEQCDATNLGYQLAQQLLAQGARELIESARENNEQ